MTSDTSICNLLPLPATIGTLTNAQSQSLNHRFPKAKISIDNCVTCQGKKTFLWLRPGTQEVATFACPCKDQHRLSRWLWHCGVLPKYQRLAWSDFVQLDQGTATEVMKYMDNLERMVSAGFGLIFTGPRGTGKTLLGHLVLKEIISKGVDAYATSFTYMIDQFAGGWSDKAQERWFNARLRDAGILLIDDLGRERNKGEGTVGDNLLETVIRHRVACELPTIVTSNIAGDSVAATYGGWTESLLAECSIKVTVPGSDSRSAMNIREQEYIKRGLTRPVVLG